MRVHDLVKKLIGPIKPVGETNEDNKRFENLQQMCSLVENILLDIDAMRYEFKNYKEFSVKRSVDYAGGFLSQNVKDLTRLNP